MVNTREMNATQILAVVLVLIAAAIEALSNVLQHKAANLSGKPDSSEAGAVLLTLKQPLFILGFALMVIGYAFHVASLGFGNLAVIQVIFVTQLVFILPFAMWISKTHIARSDWLGAIVVTVGIAVFVTFAKPSKGVEVASNAKWLTAIAVVGLLCALVIVIGYRMTGGVRAALLGVSGGLINGLVAPLTQGTITSAKGGLGALFGSWLIYVTLIAALLGVLFPLMAFRAGPITASFPAVMSLNPITATLLGMFLFNQVLQGGFFNILMMVISAIAIFIGIVWLSRSRAISDAFQEAEHGKVGGTTESATLL